MEKAKFPAVLIYGKDWSSESGPLNWDYPHTACCLWVAGLLIRETEAEITIAQDYCPETEKCREIMSIPKNTIIHRFDFDQKKWHWR